VSDGFRPDRIVIDLDPPEGALAAVRRAAKLVREALDAAVATQKLAALLAADHPEELTTVFRTALRGGRVFIDWMRNNPGATVVTPYSVRARPRASVAAPLHWVDRLRERSDPLADLAASEQDAEPFVSSIGAAFERSGLVLETFDRFRS
jgi:bifunctional non-homologous end joining protein LigD